MAGYFSHHAFYGRRGCGSWKDRHTRLAQKEAAVRELARKKAVLNRKIQLIDTCVDPDLLEQIAWTMLRRIPSDRCVVVHP
jgi:hypothetical protein